MLRKLISSLSGLIERLKKNPEICLKNRASMWSQNENFCLGLPQFFCQLSVSSRIFLSRLENRDFLSRSITVWTLVTARLFRGENSVHLISFGIFDHILASFESSYSSNNNTRSQLKASNNKTKPPRVLTNDTR